MLCNTCIKYDHEECMDCYKGEVMTVLKLTPRQWSQIELIGLAERNGVTPVRERRAICEALAKSIVIEFSHE